MTKTHSCSDSLCPYWCIVSSLATIPAMCTRVPAPLYPPAPAWFRPGYRFSSGRIWRWVWGFIHIYDDFDTWQRKYVYGGEPQEICSRSGIREQCPRCVNMNEGGKLMLLCSLSFSLCLSVIYSHFIQWAHNPRSFSVRPGKGRVRAFKDEHDCPLCLPRCLVQGNHHCL